MRLHVINKVAWIFIQNILPGSVHGAPSANTSTLDGIGLGVLGRKIEEYAYLCPGLYPWVNPGPATHESGELYKGVS